MTAVDGEPLPADDEPMAIASEAVEDDEEDEVDQDPLADDDVIAPASRRQAAPTGHPLPGRDQREQERGGDRSGRRHRAAALPRAEAAEVALGLGRATGVDA